MCAAKREHPAHESQDDYQRPRQEDHVDEANVEEEERKNRCEAHEDDHVRECLPCEGRERTRAWTLQVMAYDR